MDALMNSVEWLWSFATFMIWRIWICFAVIVFVLVKCMGCPSSSAGSEDSKTSAPKSSQSAPIREIIKSAKKLMRRNRLDDACAILNQDTLSSEEVFENDGSELHEKRFLAGRVHEIRALCLYQKGDVMGSVVEMDKGLSTVKNPDSQLMTSANYCFQLFHKWCCENFDHFPQDIVIYFQDKKQRLQTEALQNVANTSLLLESIHCLILSDFLVRREILDTEESNDVKMLCQQLYCLLNSEDGDDQTLNSLSSARKPLDAQKSENEIDIKDLFNFKETEEMPFPVWDQRAGPFLRQRFEDTMRLKMVGKGPRELEELSDELKHFNAMYEAYTTFS